MKSPFAVALSAGVLAVLITSSVHAVDVSHPPTINVPPPHVTRVTPHVPAPRVTRVTTPQTHQIGVSTPKVKVGTEKKIVHPGAVPTATKYKVGTRSRSRVGGETPTDQHLRAQKEEQELGNVANALSKEIEDTEQKLSSGGLSPAEQQQLKQQLVQLQKELGKVQQKLVAAYRSDQGTHASAIQNSGPILGGTTSGGTGDASDGTTPASSSGATRDASDGTTPATGNASGTNSNTSSSSGGSTSSSGSGQQEAAAAGGGLAIEMGCLLLGVPICP